MPYPLFQLEALESRLFMTITPSSVLTKAIRQDLVNNWSGSNKSQLQSLLDQNKVSVFDTTLLNYMTSRSSPDFFFDASSAASNASYIASHFNISSTTTHANAVLNHQFPQQTNDANYDVQIPAGDIDWLTQPGTTSNPEFLHSLNRHFFWVELASAYRYSGNTSYITELTNQLASWSAQNPQLSNANSWQGSDPPWSPLDTALRVESWVWTYFQTLSSAAWTSQANTLFLYKLQQQGEQLRNVTPITLADNRAISQYKSLLIVGDVFPEFTGASEWQTFGRSQLFASMDANRYADGSTVEQSPGYGDGVLEDLLEAKWLDAKNGITWPAARVDKLNDALETTLQFLSPDDRRSAIGDTFRTFGVYLFFKAGQIQGVSSWPDVKPESRDVWLFGTATVDANFANSPTPALGNRGKTYAMPSSGNYITRSDNSATARQLIFDAGPKGASHGHYDLLNFELWGNGRPLISDPGPYKYDSSSDRQYVISTKAHNTINVDGLNTGALQGEKNPGIKVSQWSTDNSSYAQITASHWGYSYLSGRPVVSRSMWYDLDGTILIVDWGESGSSHTFQQSFNIPTLGDTNNVTVDGTSGSTTHIRSRHASGGNVYIQPLDRPGQSAVRGPLTFVSNLATGDYKDDAYRFTVTQSGTFVCFVTLIMAYNGTTAPDTTASLLTTPTAGDNVQVQLVKNGSPQTITFTPPTLERLNSAGTNRGTYNDIEYDKNGRLHMVWWDRDDKGLKYSVRETNGKWSIAETIEPPVSVIQPGAYGPMSLALDKNNLPALAYTDGWNGDLKYANFTGTEWNVQTVESKGSTGLYPSFAFSRNNGPVMSYYNRTKGELRLAQSGSNGWIIATIDGNGDVGRFSSLMLDPNRPTASKWAIGYDANGTYRFAIQGLFSGGTQVGDYTNYVVDTLPLGGGYASLAFYDSGSNDSKRYKPALTYYDGADTALRFARCTTAWNSWSISVVASAGSQGQYTSLFFDSQNRANIFFYNRSQVKSKRAILSGGNWSITTMANGGQEVHLAFYGANLAFSNADSTVDHLYVTII